jgi:Neutral/alkaline non-lysosomal ceramidase.
MKFWVDDVIGRVVQTGCKVVDPLCPCSPFIWTVRCLCAECSETSQCITELWAYVITGKRPGYPLTNCMCPCSKIPYVCLCSQSVRKAHDSMTNGRLYVTHGDLFGVSINRSPTSYLANPAVERAKYVTANARTHTHTRTRPPHTFCCLLRHSMGAGRHGHLLGFYTL